MAFGDNKYVSLATYRSSGEAVATPVWAVPLDGSSWGFWSSSTSGKAKRLANNPAVTMQPCDARGRVAAGTSPASGTARLASPAELADIRAKVRAKYGLMVHITRLLSRIGALVKRRSQPYGDIGIVVTPDP